MKTIGVLTSGGDSPGMNAAIRAVVRTACEKGIRVIGIRRGFHGLLYNDVVDLNLRSVSDIINRGGTMLYSARCKEFIEDAGVQKGKEQCEKYGIEGLVVIGGDGSFRGARDLSNRGIPCIAIPGTIDNDIFCTDYTIGYDTAMNTVMEMVDHIRDTTEALDRCSVVEVMGNESGSLALNAGIAVGATTIWIPEIENFSIEKHILGRIKDAIEKDKKHFIIVVSEKVFSEKSDEVICPKKITYNGKIYPDEICKDDPKFPAEIENVHTLAKLIQKILNIESRATVLGHVQRGGSPTANDRFIASRMGYHAVNLLLTGQSNRVVVLRDSDIKDFDINFALNKNDPENVQRIQQRLEEIKQLHIMAHDISI